MLKKVLLSAAILIAATGITFAVLILIDGSRADEPALVLDTSKDYGACSAVTTQAIQDAFGSAANTIQEPSNLGIIEEQPVGPNSEGIVADSQVCVFAFAAGGSLENSFNANNGVSVETTVYTNEGGSTAALEQVEADPTAVPVDILGNRAFYIPYDGNEGPEPIANFELQLFTESKRITLNVRQPADSTTFTNESAREALTTLAERVQLD